MEYKDMEWCIKENERLKEEIDIYKTAFDSSYDGIHILDKNGNTLLINKACERIEGVIADEMVGKNIKDLVKEGYYSESVTLKVLKTHETVTLIQTVKNGKEVISTGTPIFKNGEVFRVVTNSRDITDLINLQTQLMETKKQSELYQKELELLRIQQLKTDDFVTRSKEMQKILDLATKVAEVDTTVLISGESGVGKELIAKIIHKTSKRNKGPYIKINCGAIPENLLESELFGYVKGAFTGANKEGKMGLFELANNGTIFLDEISELPIGLQVKLLRVLQEREIYKIGADSTIPIDVRIIAATNRDLLQMVSEKLFRQDLFYRLNVVPIMIPPLREHKEDIQPLAIHFLKKYNQKYDLNKTISSKAIEVLSKYDWPGNIRELENMIERLVVTSNTAMIDVEQLPDSMKASITGILPLEIIETSLSLYEALERYEEKILRDTMKHSNSTKEMADKLLVDRTTITRKLNKYAIPNRFK